MFELLKKIRMNKELDLSVSCYGKVKGLPYDLAVLPWGATEPHNFHLPYMTDCILSHDIALNAAEEALKQGVRCMILPPVPFGSQNPGQRELPFCIHACYETQRAILGDIVASLHTQGLRKLILVNGHGGNNFKNMLRDLSVDYPDFLIAVADWFGIVPPKEYFEESIDDHAGETETSVMMYYHPELVNLEEAGNGTSHPFAIPALNEKIAWVPRQWNKASVDTGIGNPKKSTAEKGERYVKAVVGKLTRLFVETGNKELY